MMKLQGLWCFYEEVTSARSANTLTECVFVAFVAIVGVITCNCPVTYSCGDKTSCTDEIVSGILKRFEAAGPKSALLVGRCVGGVTFKMIRKVYGKKKHLC
ncbi:hypothetical protein ATANTOWER_012912 [Ataeniobius toweri]|uniref:Uncharacterized protein n=1 Tax=Ataeniobius toweri TaxID=208326 RepID=A0ABU7A6P9_9TELE|nr:hypothetical protein [Ataeniobius toweri]